VSANDLLAVVPEMALGALGMVLVVLATVRERPQLAYGTGTIGLALALVALIADVRSPAAAAFVGTYRLDGYGLAAKAVAIAFGAVALAAMRGDLEDSPRATEAPAFVVFGTLAACALVEAQDLALIAVALTMLAAAVYGLVGTAPASVRAAEAALKFFVLSALTGAVTLYGFGLLFGLGRSLDEATLATRLAASPPVAVAFAAVLTSAAFVFESALVPIAEWAPDVYQGARTSVTLWLSVVPKTAALLAFARLVSTALQGQLEMVVIAVGVVAVASQIWGNLAAYAQRDLKRMLAYSGIAQAGFMACALAVAARSTSALDALLLYIAAYAAMNGLAFASVLAIERRFGVTTIDGLNGVGASAPWLGLALTTALLSLAGFPPFVGFAAKVALLQATFSAHEPWLGISIAVNSVLSLGYYLGPITRIWTGPQFPARPFVRAGTAAVVITAFANVVLGLAPQLAIPR
jgi:NADH-quinone oxidoreductase subunit N